MKIRWIKDPLQEDDIIISYKEESSKLTKLKELLNKNEMIVCKNQREFLINLDDILFFETGRTFVYVHSGKHAFETKEKLYQLEETLPSNFMRISKSSIVNVNQISALEQHLTSGRSIQFYKSHKITYASRMYFPLLKRALKERSFL